jgi:hypothetical protein
MTQPERTDVELTADLSEPLKERLSTWIDVAGVLGVAVGVGWGLFPVVGPYAVAIASVIVIGLNMVAGMLRRPAPLPDAPSAPVLRPLPGPTDAGPLHVAGR